MNDLLKTHRLALTICLALETIALVTLGICYYYLPHQNLYFYVTWLVFCVASILSTGIGLYFNFSVRKKKGSTELTSAKIIGADVNEAYNFGQIGIAVCDPNNTVMWINDFLSGRMSNLVDHSILEIIPGLTALSDEKSPRNLVKITYESHVYNVELLKEAHLYVFRDVTDLENANLTIKNQASVVGYIAIDNFADVQTNVSEEPVFADMLSKVRSLLNAFASSSSSMLCRVRDDRYLFLTNNENYQKILADRFSVVERVKNSFPGGNGFTLSIGVSYGFESYAKLAEKASSALDVALSRGGDQVVIAPFSEQMIYIGGKREQLPSRNRVKVRTLSNSFLTTINNYKNIVIMGHSTADFDAIGACLAVSALCRYVKQQNNATYRDGEIKICWEDQLVEDKCRLAVLSSFTKEEMDEYFVSMKNVSSLIGDDTLLIVVDVNDSKRTIFSEYFKEFKHVAVIDHHRPGDNQIMDTVFDGNDSSASSASEILTSYFTYNPKSIPMDKRTATFLLAGICLDTTFFKKHCSSSTFEAAAQLENANADAAKVEDFLKEDFEEYRQKIAVLNHAEMPMYGILIASSPDEETVSRVLLSQVANQAMTIRGIACSFCIGRTGEHSVNISARSDGTVNCQLLMEKMGGGGHFTIAATQINEVTVDVVKERLKNVLNDYLEEAKVKNAD